MTAFSVSKRKKWCWCPCLHLYLLVASTMDEKFYRFKDFLYSLYTVGFGKTFPIQSLIKSEWPNSGVYRSFSENPISMSFPTRVPGVQSEISPANSEREEWSYLLTNERSETSEGDQSGIESNSLLHFGQGLCNLNVSFQAN